MSHKQQSRRQPQSSTNVSSLTLENVEKYRGRNINKNKMLLSPSATVSSTRPNQVLESIGSNEDVGLPHGGGGNGD